MADTSENPEVQDTEQVTTPQAGDLGKQLKHCREKAGLDIEQAASEIRLSPHLLRSLEEEDFQTLPEPPYVRGYLRSYARLSDSNPNALIEIYEALRGGNEDYTTQFKPLKSIEHVAKPGMSSFTAKLLGMLLLIAVLGGLSMMPDVRHWVSNLWSSFSEKVDDAPQTDDTDTANSGDDATDTTDSSSSAISIPRIQTEKPENSAATDSSSDTNTESDTASSNLSGDIQRDSETSETTETTESDGNTQTETNETATDEAASDTEASTANTADATENSENAETAETTNNSASTTSDSEQTTTEESDATNASDETSDETNVAETTDSNNNTEEKAEDGVDNTKQPIDGKVTIRMDFEQEVWLEIRNTEDKAIFETLKSSGRQELQAHTPLKFKVGNAPGVKIYLNGVLFDQKPHTRGNVAKFEVK